MTASRRQQKHEHIIVGNSESEKILLAFFRVHFGILAHSVP